MGKSAPKPTPVNQVANAQNGSALFTAQANNTMNLGTQTNPYGSQSTSIVGYETIKDPSTGKSYQVPKYSTTTSLNAGQQALFDQNQATQGLMGQNAYGLAGQFAQPFNPDTSAIEGRLSDLGRERLDPQFAQSQQALESQLANQGIMRGSEAWTNATDQFSRQKNDAYNQLYLNGNQQAYGQLMGTHQAQLGDFLAMIGGSMGQVPNFGGPQMSQMQGVNMMGLYGNNDAAKQQQWQQQQQMYGQMLGSAGLMFL